MRIKYAYQLKRVLMVSIVLNFSTQVQADDQANPHTSTPSQSSIEKIPHSLSSAEEFENTWGQYHGVSSDYLIAITNIEDTYGVYDKRLIEPLTELGLVQKGQSDHLGALETFKRAEHLTRVNEGLYHVDQLPILKELVDSYGATNNWEMAGKTQLHVMQIEKHNYERSDPRFLAAIENLANWYLYRYERTIGLEKIQVLLKARTMNIEMIDIIESEYGEDDERLIQQYDELAKKDYQLDQYQKELALGQNPSLNSINKFADNSPLPKSKATDLTYFRPYVEGKKALIKRVKVIGQKPEVSLNERVDALLRLGDWYVVFSQKFAAEKTYRQAFDIASNHEQSLSRLEFLFSKPRKLQFGLFYESENAPSRPKFGYVDAVFDVTGVGKTRKIEIVDFQPVEFKSKHLRKMILAARFRPRMVDGDLVATEGVAYRHQF